MNKQIPYVFEDVTFYKDLAPVGNLSNVGRTRMRSFYKGKNRNGSFINEDVANMLINSAMKGNVPVIGFYNHETKDFERHMGPELAKGYGYIPVDANFAWEEYLEEDGTTKTYACFDCILFCDYFEEANEIVGKPQSMELNRDTIVGDWKVLDDDEEYFVYSFAEMKGFCVLGSEVEPCFESASFYFEKNDESKFDKFSLLLSDLMEKVKEAENNEEGGEQSMEENTIVTVEETVTETFEEHETEAEVIVTAEETEVTTEVESEAEVETIIEAVDAPNDFEILQNDYNELLEKFNNLNSEIETLRADFNEISEQLQSVTIERDEARNQFEEIQTKFNQAKEALSAFEAEAAKAEMEKKEKLISDYEKVLSEEEIDEVKPRIADFSYDELESKLAVSFSRKTVGLAQNRVPVLEQEQTDFEKLMAKYKK